jgi:hypothetical protein
MYMSVVKGLFSGFATIHADIEAAYRSIPFHHINPNFV